MDYILAYQLIQDHMEKKKIDYRPFCTGFKGKEVLSIKLSLLLLLIFFYYYYYFFLGGGGGCVSTELQIFCGLHQVFMKYRKRALDRPFHSTDF